MPEFSNTDGSLLALASVGIIAAAGALGGRGSMAELPALRQRAELEISDARLGELVAEGGNVLGALSFQEAAILDPRRIDALISQRIGRAFEDVLGPSDPTIISEIHGGTLEKVRQAYGGELPAAALVMIAEENLDQALFNTWPRLPGPLKRHIRDNIEIFEEAFDDAAEIAERAAVATRNLEDNPEWLALAEFLRGHKPLLHRALTIALPGPTPQRRRLGMNPELLTGEHNGSRYVCYDCVGDACPVHG